MHEWISAHFLNGKCSEVILISKPKLTHFPEHQYVKTTFPVHLLYNSTLTPLNIQASRVHFDLCWTKLQFGLTPIHSGRTNNKPQFHLGQTECLVVSSLRRTISQMVRTMSVTDPYFKAWIIFKWVCCSSIFRCLHLCLFWDKILNYTLKWKSSPFGASALLITMWGPLM
jgi:hypothetical protein